MFDYTLVHWLTFFSAALLLELSPGPDMAYVVGRTLSNGRRGGFLAMFGVLGGSFVHIAMAAVGLSAVIAASAVAFSIIKWLGAVYLIWIGLKALLMKRSIQGEKSKVTQSTEGSIFWQGFLIASLNPKVALFFLAFLPQFVVEGAGPVSLQLLLHGILIVAVGLIIEPLLVIVSEKLAGSFKRNIRIQNWVDKSLGLFLVFLGVRLAISEQN